MRTTPVPQEPSRPRRLRRARMPLLAVTAVATAVTAAGSVAGVASAGPDPGRLAGMTAGRTAEVSREVAVSTVGALRAAVAAALPGDRIVVADGRYSVPTPIKLIRPGTATEPITIAAAHVGKAELTGAAGFAVHAPYVVIEGFRFAHGTGVTALTSAAHVRFTRNVFKLTSTVRNWLTVAADDAEIDHNTFRDKGTVGVFLQVTGGGTSSMAKRVWVHHNSFTNHTFGGGNGGESLRLGLSTRQRASAYAVVEYNMFVRADGDREAISVKSSDNIVRYNRIQTSLGTVTLRHGNRNRVEGNLLIGGSTGIRVFGNDHTVVNNVVQSSSGQALEIPGGDIRNDTTGTAKQDAADRVLVGFNTFAYNAAKPVQLGSKSEPYAPLGITLVNNIVMGGSDTASSPAATLTSGARATWSGNLLYNLTGKGLPSSGYRTVNTRLTKDSAGIYRPAPDSPAIGAAVGAYPSVPLDLEGQVRPVVASVGADEVVGTPVTHALLTSAAVGPAAS